MSIVNDKDNRNIKLETRPSSVEINLAQFSPYDDMPPEPWYLKSNKNRVIKFYILVCRK